MEKLLMFCKHNIHMIWLSVKEAKSVNQGLIIIDSKDYPVVMQWDKSHKTENLFIDCESVKDIHHLLELINTKLEKL